MAKLDRSQSFGEVCGDTEDGTRYYQDGKRFDVHGDEICEPKPVKVKRPKAVTDTDAQLDPLLIDSA